MGSLLHSVQSWFWVATAWAALLAWLAFGSGILSHLELDAERKRTADYCKTVVSMVEQMDVTQRESWGNLLSSVSQAGICRQPNCDAADGNATAVASTAAAGPAATVNWNFAGAWFYLVSVVTTIGYGTYVPTSLAGKVATVPLAIVGIILFTIANGLIALRLRAQVKRWAGTERKTTVVLLFLCVGWMLVMAALYSEAEGWSLFDAFWFAFITTTTIGLGDFAPTVTRDWVSNYVLILGGLCFVASTLISIVTNIGDHIESSEKSTACCAGLRRMISSLARTARAAVSWLCVLVFTIFGGGMLSAIEGSGATLTMESFREGIDKLRPGGDSFRAMQAGLNITSAVSNSIGTALELLNAQGTCPPPVDATLRWSLFPATKYCFSLLTTVGWGDIAPKTIDGKVFSIFFSVFGFVVFAVASARTAVLLHEHLIETIGGTSDPARRERMWYKMRYVIAGFVMLTMWWLVAAVVFCGTEDWDFGTAFWFSFVTISTIGFGDKSPTFTGLTFIVQWIFISFGLKLFALVLASARRLVAEDAAATVKKLQANELARPGGVKAIV